MNRNKTIQTKPKNTTKKIQPKKPNVTKFLSFYFIVKTL